MAPERYSVKEAAAPRRAAYRERVEGYTPTKRALFRVRHGWFDLNGYWCVPGHGKTVKVWRGAPAEVNKILTDEQARILHNARQKARKKGVR